MVKAPTIFLVVCSALALISANANDIENFENTELNFENFDYDTNSYELEGLTGATTPVVVGEVPANGTPPVHEVEFPENHKVRKHKRRYGRRKHGLRRHKRHHGCKRRGGRHGCRKCVRRCHGRNKRGGRRGCRKNRRRHGCRKHKRRHGCRKHKRRHGFRKHRRHRKGRRGSMKGGNVIPVTPGAATQIPALVGSPITPGYPVPTPTASPLTLGIPVTQTDLLAPGAATVAPVS
ncbi:hypothetical protein AYI68_g5366 [Smittium mucronatum]|uniref:Uncharacterized protein n=1 Tax=Smittium mucronatum TaxID=133383 RepID=A0A1R0GUI0_9FUNG|nr:hypothetical protein AYI68_g5366 [Smittium mucronatum]